MRNRSLNHLLTFFCLSLQAGQAICQTIGVDPYSGAAQLTIPLWTVTSHGLEHPISISYRGGGVDLQGSSGSIGVGWTLNAGGMIRRSLRGLPDDYIGEGSDQRKGWLHNGNAQSVGEFTPIQDCDAGENANWNDLNDYGGFNSSSPMQDTEPDFYQVNSYGLNVQFVIDNEGNFQTLPYQDIKIEAVFNTDSSDNIPDQSIEEFVLTNNLGTKYHFAALDERTIQTTAEDEAKVQYFQRSYFLYKDPLTYTATWALTSITSPVGGVIEFNYGPTPLSLSYVTLDPNQAEWDDEVRLYLPDSQGQYVEDVLYTSHSEQTSYRLQSIRTDGLLVEFKNDGLPLPGSLVEEDVDVEIFLPVLRWMNVYDVSAGIRFIRTFLFDNKLVVDRDGKGSYVFLESLSEGTKSLSLPPYRFKYYGVDLDGGLTQLPNRETSETDYFGYFNNVVATSPPQIYIYPSYNGLDKFRLSPIPGYSGTEVIMSGDLRAHNPEILLFGSLRKVIQPEGGYAQAEYEPNIYLDPVTNEETYGGGIRVRKITSFDGVQDSEDIVVNYSYEDDSGNSSGVLLHRPILAFTPGYHMDPTTQAITTYDQLMASFSVDTVWKRLTIRGSEDLFKSNFGGQNVAYSQATISESGKGKTVYNFDIPAHFGSESDGSWQATTGAYARKKPVITGVDPEEISCADQSHAGLTYSYPFATNPNITFRRGLLTLVRNYDESGALVRTVNNQYTVIQGPGANAINGLKLSQLEGQFQSPPGVIQETFPSFRYNRYSLNPGKASVLSLRTETLFDQNEPTSGITTTTNYYYDNPVHRLMTRQTVANSDGSVYTTKYQYVKDLDSSGSAQDTCSWVFQLMNLANQHGRLVETVREVQNPSQNSKVVSANLTLYDRSNYDHYLPAKIFELSSGDGIEDYQYASVTDGGSGYTFQIDNRLETQSEVLSYDSYGHPESIRHLGQMQSGIHWGQGQRLPILEISNALAEEVVYSNFEEDQIESFFAPDGSTLESYGAPNKLGFSYPDNGSSRFTTGRNDAKALSLTSGTGDILAKGLSKGKGKDYAFSCWLSFSASYDLIITAKDNSGGQLDQKTITGSGSNWQFYYVTLDLGSLSESNFRVEVASTTGVYIDDAAFYPANSSIVYHAFKSPFGVSASTNGNGFTRFTEFDEFGRPKLIKDHNQNIVRRATYQAIPHPLVNQDQSSLFDFNHDPVYAGQTTEFRVIPADVSGLTCYWTIDGNPEFQGEVNQDYTFSQGGIYPVTLRVNVMSQDWITTKNVIVHPNLPVEAVICANGPLALDLCQQSPAALSECISEYPGVPASSQPDDQNWAPTTFSIQSANGGDGNYSYRWLISYGQNGVWSELSSGASYVEVGEYQNSYAIKCEVSDGSSSKGNSNEIKVTLFKSDPTCTEVSPPQQ